MSESFTKFLAETGIHKTTTAGYDPNANPVECSVGIIKRRARYLLGGCRFESNWWAVATFVAAQLCRADAGLEEYPALPFGTRVVVVKTPGPKSSFVPRAQPATPLGPREHVSGSSWLCQHGQIKAQTNFQPQGLTDHDLNWLKANLSAWDSLDALRRDRQCNFMMHHHSIKWCRSLEVQAGKQLPVLPVSVDGGNSEFPHHIL